MQDITTQVMQSNGATTQVTSRQERNTTQVKRQQGAAPPRR